jgi:hypothetical protein
MDTLDPSLFSTIYVPSKYSIDLFGSATGTFSSSLVIGGLPGLMLSMDTTMNMTSAMILSNYANQINHRHNADSPFTATADGNHLIIDGGTTANTFSASFDDPGLDNTFGVRIASTPTPEPATLTLLGLGIAGMAAYRWRRRKRDAGPM